MPRLLSNLRIEEVSSVDRGAGKGVKALLLKRLDALPSGDVDKREFSEGERSAAADRGQALPDGSFPIKNKTDLKNAIQAIGRAKNPAKAKAHIRSRARALGATDMLPDSWSKRDETIDRALALALKSLEGQGIEKHVELFKSFHEFLTQENDMAVDISKEDLVTLIGEAVTKAVDAKFEKWGHDKKAKKPSDDDADDAEKGVHSADSRRSEGDAPEETGGSESAESKDSPPPRARKAEKRDEDRSAEIAKRFEDELAKRDVENATLKKQLSVLFEKDQRAEFAKRAANIGLTESQGDLLLKVHRGDPKAIESLEGIIKGLTAQVETSDLFKTFGTDGGGRPMTAHDELVAKGDELRKADPKLTAAQAYTKAVEMYPEIAKRETQERHARIQKLAN